MDLSFSSQGIYHWILIGVVLFAAFAASVLFASWIGWLPRIDQFDSTAGVVLPGVTLVTTLVATTAPV